MNQCARCRGRFPGPGVEREGRVYRCDLCAAGLRGMARKRMRPMWAVILGVAAGLVVLSVAAGYVAGRVDIRESPRERS